MNRLWAEERGPFMYGVVMCEDAFYINTATGSFRISGKDLRVKLLKKQAYTGSTIETGLRHEVKVKRVRHRVTP